MLEISIKGDGFAFQADISKQIAFEIIKTAIGDELKKTKPNVVKIEDLAADKKTDPIQCPGRREGETDIEYDRRMRARIK